MILGTGAARRASGVLLALCVTAGCGDAASATHPATPSRHTTAATEDAAAEPAAWVRMSDPASGTTFSLPEHVDPQSRTQVGSDGRTYRARMYQAEVDGLAVSLVVTQAKGGFAGYDTRMTYRAMAQRLRTAGAKDLRLTGLTPTKSGRLNGYDATITFTSLQGDVTYWRMRSLADSHVLLSMQAQVFVPKVTEQTRARVDSAFEQLNRSLGRA